MFWVGLLVSSVWRGMYLSIHLDGQLDVLGGEALESLELCSHQLQVDRMEEGVVSSQAVEVGVHPLWPQKLGEVRMEFPAQACSRSTNAGQSSGFDTNPQNPQLEPFALAFLRQSCQSSRWVIPSCPLSLACQNTRDGCW